MKLVIHPDYQYLENFLMQLPQDFENNGTLVYKARNVLKTFYASDLELNVKKYRKPLLVNRIAYTFFRKSKARRAYENAEALLKCGFDTPQPVAYLELFSDGLLERSYFVSLQLTDFRMMREFADGSDVKGREDIIRALGVYVADLHVKRILHLDLSVGNVLFRKENDVVKFWMVDLNRMRFCTIGKKKGCRNFERLRGNDDFFRILVESYAAERGFDPELCLKNILFYQQKSVRNFARKSLRKKRLREKKTKR
jgi:hypothetical protein